MGCPKAKEPGRFVAILSPIPAHGDRDLITNLPSSLRGLDFALSNK